MREGYKYKSKGQGVNGGQVLNHSDASHRLVVCGGQSWKRGLGTSYLSQAHSGSRP